MVKQNIFKFFFIFVAGAIGGIFADQFLWPYFVEKPLFYEYQLEDRPVYLTKEIIIQENFAIVEAAAKVEKAIIGVKTQDREGNGLAVTSDGLVVTLAELVPQGERTEFYVDGSVVVGRILKRDLTKNLALAKIEKPGLPTVSFAEFSEAKRGQRVFLSGLVFINKLPERTVNEGIIKHYNQSTIYTNIESDILGSSLFDIEGNALGLNSVNKKGELETISIQTIKEFAGL